MKFYVYVLSDPDTGSPFYVGKGSGNRWRYHLRPNARERKFNELKNEFIEEIQARGKQVNCCVIARFQDEQESFDFECLLIKKIGRLESGGPLVNGTDGGYGGWASLSPEAKAKQHRFKPGQTYTPERNAKIGAYWKGRPKTPEQRAKLAETNRTRELSPAEWDRQRKMNQGNVGRKHTDKEMLERRNAKLRGRKRTPEQLVNIRAAIARRPSRKGIPMSEEAKAKLGASMRAAWANNPAPRAIRGPDGKFTIKTNDQK